MLHVENLLASAAGCVKLLFGVPCRAARSGFLRAGAWGASLEGAEYRSVGYRVPVSRLVGEPGPAWAAGLGRRRRGGGSWGGGGG